MECRDIHSLACWFRLGFISENPDHSLKKLVFSLFDLVGMYIELLGQYNKCLFASFGSKCYFRLENQVMFRRGRLVMVFPVPGT